MSGATLHASVIPNGLATTAYFEWGTDNTFAIPNVTPDPGGGIRHHEPPGRCRSHRPDHGYEILLPGGRHQFGRDVEGPDSLHSPRTRWLRQWSRTRPRRSRPTDAVLNGDVNPNGLATTYHFEWGTDNTFTTFDNTSSLSAGSGISSTPVTASISGLTLGTKYYFRITANNSSGPSTGTIRNFTTVNPPPTANAGPDQTVYMLGASGPTEVTLDGSGSADGGGGTLTYQWTQTAGAPVTLSDPTAAKLTFTAPVVILSARCRRGSPVLAYRDEQSGPGVRGGQRQHNRQMGVPRRFQHRHHRHIYHR